MTTRTHLAEKALDILFPQRCIFCGNVTAGGVLCCAKCEKLLRRNGDECKLSIGGSVVYSCFYYKDAARDRTNDLKFYGKPELAEYFADEMTSLLRDCMDVIDFNMVAYLPMPALRQEGRGYNQAELLARGIAKRLDLPCSLCGLERIQTFAQHDLHLSMRKKQTGSGFSIAEGQRVSGKLLLVDDICTSGSTLRSCIKLLRQAGAEEVTAVTVCR